ncbi:PREDICTED: uncharacterized protein LOC104803943 isoform X2 [Tarenaya hassleriana]|uniref:uncharacterized protein LOC104803943 isoform X2 n=1 Tax=Tarenaya hassleriana TaxID=28532 RepID=UPI00053C6CDC|nr:PREDICTED: uncharacterized protein LOC104803943 isoform X2 [Tarenaya hassleriana]
MSVVWLGSEREMENGDKETKLKELHKLPDNLGVSKLTKLSVTLACLDSEKIQEKYQLNQRQTWLAHSRVDDHLVRWFGLDQSKYQWALDEYYETKGPEMKGVKAKEMPGKAQGV